MVPRRPFYECLLTVERPLTPQDCTATTVLCRPPYVVTPSSTVPCRPFSACLPTPEHSLTLQDCAPRTVLCLPPCPGTPSRHKIAPDDRSTHASVRWNTLPLHNIMPRRPFYACLSTLKRPPKRHENLSSDVRSASTTIICPADRSTHASLSWNTVVHLESVQRRLISIMFSISSSLGVFWSTVGTFF